MKHDTGMGHPERPARIQAVLDHLDSLKITDKFLWVTPEPASKQQILSNHGNAYIESVERLAAIGGGFLDADTVVSSESYKAALRATGACVEAIDAVVKKDANNAFCLNRPPGHHARPNAAMGFCFFNSVAIGARHALKRHGMERVFILDWDVHHGNGTQESFYDDPSVFFCSIHQSPLYPGTGLSNETGIGEGAGFTLNLTVPSGTRGDLYQSLLDEKILPAMREFQPELILISAGFDAHRLDPLAGVQLEDEDFYRLTRGVLQAADSLCKGRVVSVLEGGYDLQGLSGGVEQHLRAMLEMG
ncbi:MAG: histone deacetylase [Verrucomicrobia bacterium]|nr:histone deacetylase [Verrucomicrobiota bacterium]